MVQVAQHGDPVPANILGRHEAHGVAVDWAHLGTGPVGADLGYLSLGAREELGPLVDAYVQALRDLGATVATGRFGAHMRVQLTNDGPVTLILDTAEL